MPNATWGDPESRADEAYSPALLRQLLQQMMRQFAASGACIALFDESIGQMVVRMHVRARGTDSAPAHAGKEPDGDRADRKTERVLLRDPDRPLGALLDVVATGRRIRHGAARTGHLLLERVHCAGHLLLRQDRRQYLGL